MKDIQIIVYITSNKDKVLSGNPLCLFIQDEAEKQQILLDITRALKANAVHLKNGDSMIISE
jgi:hypothetical protein